MLSLLISASTPLYNHIFFEFTLLILLIFLKKSYCLCYGCRKIEELKKNEELRKMNNQELDEADNKALRAYSSGALIHHLSLLRNKRCLMAYVYVVKSFYDVFFTDSYSCYLSLYILIVTYVNLIGIIEQKLYEIWPGQLSEYYPKKLKRRLIALRRNISRIMLQLYNRTCLNLILI